MRVAATWFWRLLSSAEKPQIARKLPNRIHHEDGWRALACGKAGDGGCQVVRIQGHGGWLCSREQRVGMLTKRENVIALLTSALSEPKASTPGS